MYCVFDYLFLGSGTGKIQAQVANLPSGHLHNHRNCYFISYYNTSCCDAVR